MNARISLTLSALIAACAVLSAVPAADPALPAKIEFNRDIRPILADTCFHCHGPDQAKRKAKLRFDTEEGATADLGGHRAIVPGKPDESELLRRITAMDENERMPPAKSARRLSPRQIELLRAWIAQGARYEKHWAYIAPVRAPVPQGVNTSRSGAERNPIDAFVLAKLRAEGLAPVPEADKATLIRRVTLDLTGLPPTPAEVDAFVADPSPEAYERVVDRLLASPRYGERMVLEWLDAARYADSNGYQTDGTRTLWPWRDWVIDALNYNLPFDEFTVQQIAGDLLAATGNRQSAIGQSREAKESVLADSRPPTAESRRDLLVATGFHRNHMLNGEGGRVAEESRVDYVVDRVDTTATVWLGLTLGCARCHDHKYDPFSQKDYYQLFAFFNNIAEVGGVDRGGNAAPVLRLPTPEQTARIEERTKALAALEPLRKPLDAKLQPTLADAKRQVLARLSSLPPLVDLPDSYAATLPERIKLEKRAAEARKALDDANKAVVQTMVMEERPQPRDTHVLIRGAWDKPGEKVTADVPALLSPLSKPPAAAGSPSRLELARWLVSPANPLTARVTVNRHWQMFFGVGLVRTTEDFGIQGEPPSHPELLDWLACEFAGVPSPPMAMGGLRWDVKALHRLIVTSATYRQSSKQRPELRERDPENRLLARGPRQRLSAFALRDQALAVSGLLVEQLGGPPVRPYQPPGIWEEMTFGQVKYVQDKGPSLHRRSLYTFWRRTVGPTTMFDASARQVCVVRQGRTNTPLQSLILLNDVTYVEAARSLAERVLAEAANANERLALLFKLTVARAPTAEERPILMQALERLRQHYQTDPASAKKLAATGEAARRPALDPIEVAAWTGLANLVLNLDEVLCRE